MKGYLITFEGIEGSGKSSQIAALADRLRAAGREVLTTREPGGTKLGEGIRELLLDARHDAMDPKAELLLYLASRAQHLAEVIRPALAQGKIVLCDRFSEATLAYQGYGRGLGLQEVRSLIHYAAAGRRPDLTLLLDVEVRRGLARIRSRAVRDRLDQQQLAFYERVRNGYLSLARRNPMRIVVINANADFQQVAQRIDRVVKAFLKSHRAIH